MPAALFALRHPEVFGNVLSQSGSFRGRRAGTDEPNTISDMYIRASRAPIRFYIETGLYDNAPNASLPIYEMILDETNLQGNRHFRDVLRAKGYDVTAWSSKVGVRQSVVVRWEQRFRNAPP